MADHGGQHSAPGISGHMSEEQVDDLDAVVLGHSVANHGTGDVVEV